MAKHCNVAEIRAINLQSFFCKRKRKKNLSRDYVRLFDHLDLFVRILLFYLVFFLSFHYSSSSYVYHIMFYLLLLLLFNLFLQYLFKIISTKFLFSRRINYFSQYYRNIIFVCSFLSLSIIFLLSLFFFHVLKEETIQIRKIHD